MQITQSSQSSQVNQMQNSNEIVFEFYNNDQVIEEMLQNFDARDYDSDVDSDYKSDENDENDDLGETEESDSMPDLIDDDDVSDTDILDSDDDDFQNIQVIEESHIPVSPPQLRRERPEDYLTPFTTLREIQTPPAPRQQSRVLRDITNQTNQTQDISDGNIINVSRRLFFN
jgi:hypothetical protein